jgi:hypothetical protein
VVGIQHEGAAWWPTGASTAARPDRWARVAAPLAEVVDVLLGGHVLGAWCGDLHGTPAGHAFAFESSVLVVDLPASRDRPVVRGCFRVPPRAPEEASPATEVVVQAAERIVGRLESRWLGRPDAVDYLPDRIADALRRATGADAALVFGGQHATQAPLDGAVAALGPGPVSELDLFRLFPYDDDRPVVVELRPEELAAAVRAHDAVTDPDNRDGDHVWWNSIRMRAGVSATGPTPASVAVMPFILGRLGELLGRELAGEPAATGGRQAVLRALS